MPKGKRTATDNFGKDLFTVEAGSSEPKQAEGFASKNETKNRDVAKKYIVGSGYDVETIVRLDRSGAILVFEQKEAFIQLDDAVVGGFSAINKLNYEIAKQFHDAWRGDEHAKLVEEFQVNPNMQGSATDKLTAEGPKDMVVRWTAPYLVEKRRAKGYKVLSADEAKSFLGATGGHHEIGRLGQTELVLMGIPKELYEARQKEKTRDNLEKAGLWQSSGLADINRNGGQGFVDTETGGKRRDWHEIPNPGDSEE